MQNLSEERGVYEKHGIQRRHVRCAVWIVHISYIKKLDLNATKTVCVLPVRRDATHARTASSLRQLTTVYANSVATTVLRESTGCNSCNSNSFNWFQLQGRCFLQFGRQFRNHQCHDTGVKYRYPHKNGSFINPNGCSIISPRCRAPSDVLDCRVNVRHARLAELNGLYGKLPWLYLALFIHSFDIATTDQRH